MQLTSRRDNRVREQIQKNKILQKISKKKNQDKSQQQVMTSTKHLKILTSDIPNINKSILRQIRSKKKLHNKT